MPIVRMRTTYLGHLDLAPTHRVLSRLVQQLPLHHSGHTKQECDAPTTTVERCTNHACYRPIQNIEAQEIQVQSSRFHYGRHPLKLAQVGQLLQTIVLTVAAQQLCHSGSNVQRHECMVAFQRRCVLAPAALQQVLYVHRSDLSHQIQYSYL